MNEKLPATLNDVEFAGQTGAEALAAQGVAEHFGEDFRSLGLTGFISKHHADSVVDASKYATYNSDGAVKNCLPFWATAEAKAKNPEADGSFALAVLQTGASGDARGEDRRIDHLDAGWRAIGIAPKKDGDNTNPRDWCYVVFNGGGKYKEIDIAEHEALRLILKGGDAAGELMVANRSELIKPAKAAETPEIAAARAERKEIKLRPNDVVAATERLDHLLHGQHGNPSAQEFAKFLQSADPNATAESLRAKLDPNSGDKAFRAQILGELEIMLNRMANDDALMPLLPSRVRDENGQKSIIDAPFELQQAGYFEKSEYSSREYVAVLARAMLDGAYCGEKGKTELNQARTDMARGKEPTGGQHRLAAERLLKQLGVQDEIKEKNKQAAEEFSEDIRRLRTDLANLVNNSVGGDLTRSLHDVDHINVAVKTSYNDHLDGSEIIEVSRGLFRRLNEITSALGEWRTRLMRVAAEQKPDARSRREQGYVDDAQFQMGSVLSVLNDLANPLDRGVMRQLWVASKVGGVEGALPEFVRRGDLDRVFSDLQLVKDKLNNLIQS